MCGIVGQLRFDGPSVDRALVHAMAERVSHRGPDGCGFHFDRHVGMGHRRLAMVDPGSQGEPVRNEDRTLFLVGNHEVYNHPELRRELRAAGVACRSGSDAEVLLRLFERSGVHSFPRLVGMFAIAIWDARGEVLYLVRDPLGIKPLHFARGSHGALLFASEIAPLLLDPGVDRSLDMSAFDGYLRTLTVPEPRSIFASVHKVPAGHYARIDRDGITLARYASPGSEDDAVDDSKRIGWEESELAARLLDEVDSTIALSLEGDTEIGCFLSGGVDSSAIVARASRLLGRPIRTYSMAFEEKPFDESASSRLVSRRFGTRHTELRLCGDEAADLTSDVLDHLHEPFADSSALPTYALARAAAYDVKGVLSGEGLDELFGGNSWHRMDSEDSPEPAEGRQRDQGWEIFTDYRLETLLDEPLLDEIRKLDAHRRTAEETVTGGSRVGHDLDRLLLADLQGYLPSDLLTKMDRLPMANSLEVRVPYLNLPFVRFALGIDPDWKVRDGVQKFLFKRALRGVLPDSILQRQKQGFAIPMDIWIWCSGRFRDLVLDTLRDRRTIERGWFRPEAVEAMIEEHTCLDHLHGYRLWTLFVFEMWQRRHLDGGPGGLHFAARAAPH